MHAQSKSSIQRNARQLRRHMTDAELALWRRLRGEQLGVKFRRQHPYLEFILDFVCLERKLVIEVDGAQHMNQTAYDEARSAVLKGAGFRLMRFWDNDVLVNTDAVLEAIYVELGAVERKPIPTPAPPREGEGGFERAAPSAGA
jgi:very-short-patch-repair endonuclease